MALPTAPSRSMDQTTFDNTTDAFVGALPQFETDMNALAAAMNLNDTIDTSSTSNSIATGSKTFTVTAGKSFVGGMWLVIADTAAPSTNSMAGQVTSYSGTTLVINVTNILGSGTKTAWTISQNAGGLYANLAGSASQDFTTKKLTVSQTEGVVGTTTNNNVQAGSVGEYIESDLTSFSGSLVDSTAGNITSISLTAGDWDVSGVGHVAFTASNTLTQLIVGISTVSATLPGTGFMSYLTGSFTLGTSAISQTPPTSRVSLASTTTVYLVVRATFSAGTLQSAGRISARRVR